MYGIEESFWLKLILLVAIVFLLVFLFEGIMRRMLNVEKKKRFSYNHVNQKHKKIDWIIRITTMIALLSSYVIDIVMRVPLNSIWFIQPWFILFLFIFISETVTAVMERKYVDNPNAYKLTISVMLFSLLLLSLVVITSSWLF